MYKSDTRAVSIIHKYNITDLKPLANSCLESQVENEKLKLAAQKRVLNKITWVVDEIFDESNRATIERGSGMDTNSYDSDSD